MKNLCKQLKNDKIAFSNTHLVLKRLNSIIWLVSAMSSFVYEFMNYYILNNQYDKPCSTKL